MTPIFLIGYMGSGKTTLGRALAKEMKFDFIDLDIYIETRYCRSVRDIFAERGEDGFREIERNMLHEIADFENVIVACGGGTPCHFDNMDVMLSHGTTVFLSVPIPRLVQRLCLPGSRMKRPLVADKTDSEMAEYISKALEERLPYYNRAKITFDGSKLETASQIGESIAKLRGLLPQE
jgi:shikimate kinase